MIADQLAYRAALAAAERELAEVRENLDLMHELQARRVLLENLASNLRGAIGGTPSPKTVSAAKQEATPPPPPEISFEETLAGRILAALADDEPRTARDLSRLLDSTSVAPTLLVMFKREQVFRARHPEDHRGPYWYARAPETLELWAKMHHPDGTLRRKDTDLDPGNDARAPDGDAGEPDPTEGRPAVDVAPPQRRELRGAYSPPAGDIARQLMGDKVR